MHLFLVRHGESLSQCDPAVSNHPDTPLSPRGEEQAVAKERPDWPLYPPVQAEVWANNDTSHLLGI